mgnify:CR=1 FL=1
MVDAAVAAVEETTGKTQTPVRYVSYEGEEQLPSIMALVDDELSEPYSIFTYRYFITIWPQLCFMVCTSVSFSLFFFFGSH